MRSVKIKKTACSKKCKSFVVRQIIQYVSSSSHGVREAILFFIACALIVIFGSLDDHEAISLYLEKLQTLSDHKISIEQKLMVSDFYCANRVRHPTKALRHATRKNFNSKKKKLKTEWELEYKLKWPKIFSYSQMQISKAIVSENKDYEAHHIVPINAGGVNVWWNISPLTSENHGYLHKSIEEKACFSHDLVQQKILRLLLRIKCLLFSLYKKISPNNRLIIRQDSYVGQP